MGQCIYLVNLKPTKLTKPTPVESGSILRVIRTSVSLTTESTTRCSNSATRPRCDWFRSSTFISTRISTKTRLYRKFISRTSREMNGNMIIDNKLNSIFLPSFSDAKQVVRIMSLEWKKFLVILVVLPVPLDELFRNVVLDWQCKKTRWVLNWRQQIDQIESEREPNELAKERIELIRLFNY
jgi:hypothetical protein